MPGGADRTSIRLDSGAAAGYLYAGGLWRHWMRSKSFVEVKDMHKKSAMALRDLYETRTNATAHTFGPMLMDACRP